VLVANRSSEQAGSLLPLRIPRLSTFLKLKLFLVKITSMANKSKIDETEFNVGDTIIVYQKIQEEKKMRTQPFEGIVIAIKGRGENKSFTVRKIGAGQIGVERIWPLNSPWIEKIEVKKKGKVRRAKLYYLRKKVGKKAVKIKEKKVKKTTPEVKKPRKKARKASPKTPVSKKK
jgi:large subunit ribosomal protein L19